jgi:hypothetical protein
MNLGKSSSGRSNCRFQPLRSLRRLNRALGTPDKDGRVIEDPKLWAGLLGAVGGVLGFALGEVKE